MVVEATECSGDEGRITATECDDGREVYGSIVKALASLSDHVRDCLPDIEHGDHGFGRQFGCKIWL